MNHWVEIRVGVQHVNRALSITRVIRLAKVLSTVRLDYNFSEDFSRGLHLFEQRG